MKKRGATRKRVQAANSSRVTIGRVWGEKISAVEGIELSPAARRRADQFEQLGVSPARPRSLNPDATLAAIIASFGGNERPLAAEIARLIR
jgi:hypothetical protein